MINQLTEKQIEWAKQHNWFDHVDECGCIVVIDEYSKEGKFYSNPMIWNGSHVELRRWAGY